jgi:orotate phosphoribosyltransferase
LPHPEFTPGELERELRRTGALLEGHFLLSSGLHSPRYVQCARLLQHPDLAERAGRSIATLFAGAAAKERPVAVLSPALGGVVIGHEVARALGVRALFAERDGAAMVLRRGFELGAGEAVLLVEDVVTTGKSVGELADLARSLSATPIGIGAIVDRSGGELSRDFGGTIDVRALVTLEVPRFAPGDCPGCRAGTPAIKPGSRPTP